MFDIGWSELLVIAIVILIFFGGNKIPSFMRGLGKGIGEFNKARNGLKKEVDEGKNPEPKGKVADKQNETDADAH